ncbi:MAG: Stp1/IreP family PP2C-type Ser/Thr phosphatase [Muribaculaceae bacterium]|nr:Stp1/IreP family PP2C-type Ser/Thr phosphatase [Muribaculaceae bacterium]
MSIVNYNNGVCALTNTGLVRTQNEDSNRVESTQNGELFVVCDGMGGHVGGATASKIGVDSICQYAQQHTCVIPQQFLIKALEYANAKIYATACAKPELKGMGTTACVALVRGDKVWYAHVGDSRIYYFNDKQNTLYRLTKDHSVVQALIDQGLITEEEAEHHPDKNKIRRSLGIKADVDAEPCQIPLVPCDNDILLICSDGLSGMMSEDDIREVLATTHDVNEAGKMLVELANSGGGTDNITVQLVRFSGTDNKQAIFDAKNSGVAADVSKTDKTAKMRISKSFWKWIILGVVALLVSIALFMTIMSPKDDGKTTTTGISAEKKAHEPAYIKEIPQGANPIDYYHENRHFLYFENTKDPSKSLRVDLSNDSTYIIGTFERRKNSGDGVSGPFYNLDKTKAYKEYKKDGTPR